MINIGNKIKKGKKISIFPIVNSVMLGLFALLCLFPFVYELLIAFASKEDYYAANFLVIPYHLTFENFKYIFFQGTVGGAFLRSIFTTIVGLIYNMALTIILAYALSRTDMFGNRFLFVFVLITMFFGGGLVPFYVTVQRLGLMNNLTSVIVPFGLSSFNAIILRNFFRRVPQEVLDSCKIDGASEFIILVRFIVPLSLAGIATVALFYGVERWNDWYWPMLFITDSEQATLALELRNILSANQSAGMGGGVDTTITFSEGQNAATIIIAVLPVLIAYPFVQKYFVQGTLIGGIKE